MTRNTRNSQRFGATLLCATAAALLFGAATAAAQRPSTLLHPDTTALRAGATPLMAEFRPPPVNEKSAGTATLFSLLITGGGQLYNEETTKGVVMLTSGILFTAMALGGVDEYDCDEDETCYPWLLPAGIGGALAVKIWSIADAAVGARRWNEGHKLASLSVKPSVALNPFGNKSMRVGVRGTF